MIEQESSLRVPSPKEVFADSPANRNRLFDGAERIGSDVWAFNLNSELLDRANLGFDLDGLPGYVGINGGAARQVLMALTDTEYQFNKQPRDVDLIFFGDEAPRGGCGYEQAYENAQKLAGQLSPRDVMYGHGAREVADMEGFLGEVDFTINQVMLRKGETGWSLCATTQAVIDAYNHIIRPTIFELDDEGEYLLGNKLALKAVRLLSEMQVDGLDDA